MKIVEGLINPCLFEFIRCRKTYSTSTKRGKDAIWDATAKKKKRKASSAQ